MPQSPPRLCRCGAIVSGVCEACRIRRAEPTRPNSSERGYDALWQDFRAWYIARHPLCVDCLAVGRYRVTREVHHIKKLASHPELRLVESNVMPLCKPCHSTRTARGE